MALRGTAFVAIWHGVQAGAEADYLNWHTHEHMPERLGVPGFLQGRRYVDWSLQLHPSFTLYEGAHIETFRSPGYLARLNDPTPWSNDVQPKMTSFLRGGCETLLSFGKGVGGAITTIRLMAPENGKAFEKKLSALAVEFSSATGVTSVHVARHVSQATGGETAETRMRPSVSGDAFSHVVLIEGIAPRLLGKAHKNIEQSLRSIEAGNVFIASYPLDFALRAPE